MAVVSLWVLLSLCCVCESSRRLRRLSTMLKVWDSADLVLKMFCSVVTESGCGTSQKGEEGCGGVLCCGVVGVVVGCSCARKVLQ